MAKRILITPRSLTRDGHPALRRFANAGYEVVMGPPGTQPSEEDLIEVLPGCVGMLAGVERISARAIEAATDLKVIGRNGVGIDNIDLEAAKRKNIAVCPAIGANARGVAELTIGLVLSLARSIPFSDAGLKSQSWQRRKGFELRGKTLGLVGLGCIGREVALMGLSLGMKVLAFDPIKDSSFSPGGAFRYVEMEQLWAEFDVISLHCPALEGNRPLINSEAIAKMKKGVYIVNTARASLIDEQAVLEALESGQLAGLAIDVFAKEPPGDSPLVEHSRVIATPHIGGYTDQSVDRAVTAAIELILDHLKGS